jgi:hypothetical protein
LVVTDGLRSAYVVLGNGDGTFGPSTKIPLHTDPIGIAIADLNGDGVLDLDIAIFGPENGNQGETAILIGVGDGSFESPVYYPLTHNGVRLVATDLNHDGKLDLAVAVQHFSTQGMGWQYCWGMGMGLSSRPSLPCQETPKTSRPMTLREMEMLTSPSQVTSTCKFV